MVVTEYKLKGIFEIQLEAKEDFRGFFMRTYDDAVFAKHGIDKNWVQEYHNLSLKKGTIRGLHLQLPPFTETKLIRVLRGSTLDVFVDLRKHSPTFGQWGSAILSAENKKMIYISQGFAHGLCSLEDNTMVLCKMDNHHSPEHERQVKWDDPDLSINWQLEGQAIVSQKDAAAKSFKEFTAECGGTTV
ncbi:MAG: dTDP-4-dehydrorhamnose 3,5-epimerase [Candidatus Staskawiczbacteria bacterium]|nr:dTDP-4-dehydrorhamnose 3,5-epimerase [Candidatus Staskawiczbacteria bacterium]